MEAASKHRPGKAGEGRALRSQEVKFFQDEVGGTGSTAGGSRAGGMGADRGTIGSISSSSDDARVIDASAEFPVCHYPWPHAPLQPLAADHRAFRQSLYNAGVVRCRAALASTPATQEREGDGTLPEVRSVAGMEGERGRGEGKLDPRGPPHRRGNTGKYGREKPQNPRQAVHGWRSEGGVGDVGGLSQEADTPERPHRWRRLLAGEQGHTGEALSDGGLREGESARGGPFLGWWDHLGCVSSHFLFSLAVENRRVPGYVTEKLFQALEAGELHGSSRQAALSDLMTLCQLRVFGPLRTYAGNSHVFTLMCAGSVPVYFGAPDVEVMVPPGSYIDGSKLSVSELRRLIESLRDNTTAYMDYLAWRRFVAMTMCIQCSQPFSPANLVTMVSIMRSWRAPILMCSSVQVWRSRFLPRVDTR